jgi:hypothetical protein
MVQSQQFSQASYLQPPSARVPHELVHRQCVKELMRYVDGRAVVGDSIQRGMPAHLHTYEDVESAAWNISLVYMGGHCVEQVTGEACQCGAPTNMCRGACESVFKGFNMPIVV